MFKIKIILLTFLFISSISFAADGLIQLKSHHSVKQTTKNLLDVLKKKGMTVFDVIKHKKGAHKVGKKLRPTTVVIFGNPKVGTPLMQCAQTAAIDLPQKALIYKDANGQVWYAYNNPHYLVARHNIKGCKKPLAKITNALANFAKAAIK
jgi:uncharacterized protein (DUF302 family)